MLVTVVMEKCTLERCNILKDVLFVYVFLSTVFFLSVFSFTVTSYLSSTISVLSFLLSVYFPASSRSPLSLLFPTVPFLLVIFLTDLIYLSFFLLVLRLFWTVPVIHDRSPQPVVLPHSLTSCPQRVLISARVVLSMFCPQRVICLVAQFIGLLTLMSCPQHCVYLNPFYVMSTCCPQPPMSSFLIDAVPCIRFPLPMPCCQHCPRSLSSAAGLASALRASRHLIRSRWSSVRPCGRTGGGGGGGWD